MGLPKSFSKNQYPIASMKQAKVLKMENPNETCTKQMNLKNNKNQNVGLESTFLQGKGDHSPQIENHCSRD